MTGSGPSSAARSLSSCRRTTAMSTTRAGRAAFRARTVAAGRSRTIAVAGTPAACARTSSDRRADGSMFVASTTAAGRRRDAVPAPRGGRLNAALVAAWFASSPETIVRNASDDRTSSGAKWRAAKVDLPGAGRADEDDQARVGEDDLGHAPMMAPSGGVSPAPDLVAAALGGADLVGGLVVDRRAAADVPVAQPEARAVPWALDAAVDDRPLRRAARRRARRRHGARGRCRRCGRGRGR